jgi:ferritin
MEDALNTHMNAELYSSYLYYSMSAYFEAEGLQGCAHWMRLQALEEMTHVAKFFAYINDRGGRVLMQPIDGPETNWDNPTAVFQATLDHEVTVTGLINKLVDLSLELSDHATNNFLQWFVGEQVEEEATAEEILTKMKRVENSPGGLFQLDSELAARTVTLPPGFPGAA